MAAEVAFGTPNYLKIPEDLYGTTGVQTGNTIYAAFAKSKLKLSVSEFDKSKEVFTVFNSAMIARDIIEHLLNKRYCAWKACISEGKDANGNFLIKLESISIYGRTVLSS